MSVNQAAVQKRAVFWNAVASCLNSFQTMILLIVLTRFGTDADSGNFVMAYAAGNLMMHIGKFGMRQYQVTDIREKYSWPEYVRSRVFTMILMPVATGIYLLWGILGKGYTSEKALFVLLICVYKGIEAAEDVFHGRLQQQGRLDIAAKILAIRFAVFIAGFAVLYILTRNLLLTGVVNVAVTLVLCLLLNKKAASGMEKPLEEPEKEKTKGIPFSLLKECFPLAVMMITFMYLGNAPKYVIDGVVSDEVQTCFNIVFMPAFVIALLANFIYNPVLKHIGELWTEGKAKELRNMAGKLALVPVALTVAAVVAGWFFGPWAFGLVYKVDVSAYRVDLVVFLIASGVIALLNLCASLLTAMRRQPHLLWSFSAASLLTFLAGKPVLQAKGLTALSLFYLAVLCAVLVYCASVILLTLNRKNVYERRKID